MQKEENTDYFLWKRMKSGEPQAFQEVYTQYAEILFSFGMVYSKDQELVKDCIHDLFFDLYKYRKNLADNDHIRNYLFKSLKRKIYSSTTGKLSLVYTSQIQDAKEMGPDWFSGEDFDEQEMQMEKIRKAISKLSAKQQEVLNLRFQVGLTYSELAKILDISVESVRTLVYRSIKAIREQLEVKGRSLLLMFLELKTCKTYR
jgi:RNA polymerase sigma factor (sigma-70 family)